MLHQFFDSTISALVIFINQIGYLGIFVGMFLESTLVPIPSEIIMIPAGIAASKGSFNIYLVMIVGIVGNVFGALFSYYLAASLGRTIIFRIGKYFFVKAETIIKIENFFQKHGKFSVFIGRLLPGFRHFISIPAGIAKMNIKSFCIYTSLGSSIWTVILAALGFAIGDNQELINENLERIAMICFFFCIALFLTYFLYARRVQA